MFPLKLGELKQLAQAFSGIDGADAQQKMRQRMLELNLDSGTFYQELEMTSRFVDTHRDISFSNAHMQLHSHTFYELLYCTNTCGAEYLVGSERYRLRQGDLVFIPPGVSHRPLLPDNMSEPYRRYVLWLSAEFMDFFAALFSYPFTEKQAQASLLRTGGTRWEQLGKLFRAGVEETERQADGWEAAVIGNTMQLLTQIKRATNARSAQFMQAEKPELLDRITAYIEANYSSEINIRDLSRQFYVSESTISHLFKQKMGVSLYRYVTQRRLIAAKSLIEKGSLLEDVCAQVGFSDYSGFYRAFRQVYGISPRQYRSLQDSNNQKALVR